MSFVVASSGASLLVTFVPGMVFTWLTFFWIHSRGIDLPDRSSFVPLYFVTLAVQFLHFGEEYINGFPRRFPALYGGEPYPDDLFVVFNLGAYAAFAIACVLVFYRGMRFLLVPVLFFVIYGAMGNAIAHTFWTVYLREYFPGVLTAQVYWVLGPLLFYRLLGSRRSAIVLATSMSVVLPSVLYLFMTP